VILDVSESQRSLSAEPEKLVTQFLNRMIGSQDRGFVVA
jgi:hypothetical protein